MSDVIENLTAPAQFVPFELHPNTLRTIIQEQSGTWQKAIAELVMNSVDAGATRIDINYECDEKYTRLLKLNVSDDGHGFHNEDQLNFFKMFGAPMFRVMHFMVSIELAEGNAWHLVKSLGEAIIMKCL